VIQSFRYSDNWHAPTDGDGPTLVAANVLGPTQSWNDAAGWRASHESGGSPGGRDLIRGDLNEDDRVDLVDATMLQANLGLSAGATRSQGDLNGDGAVSRIDAALLARNYGRSYAAEAVPSAPEALVAAARDLAPAARPRRGGTAIAATARRRLDAELSDQALAESLLAAVTDRPRLRRLLARSAGSPGS
jgi:hypothetical protein